MKTMKLKITLFFIVICSVSFGQSINETELIGTWKVENLSGDFPQMPKEQQQIMDLLKTAFKNATFDFKEDKRFNFNIDFIELDEMMKNVHWKLDSGKSEIIIQEWKDKDTDKYHLMGITVLRKEGKIFFILTESPFVLEVKNN